MGLGVVVAVVEVVGVWLRVMKREKIWGSVMGEGSGVQLCDGRELEREAEKLLEEREKKWGEKKKVGPVTVINWDPQKN